MTLHVLHIIRDMSDRGSAAQRRCPYSCPDIDPPMVSFWKPNTDIFESEGEVRIRIELAGVSRENISIELKNGKLIVSGIRLERRPEERICYHQLEQQYGHFMRIIALPEAVEHNEITAALEDGVLEVIISKDERAVEIPITGFAEKA